ncbi:FUSC family protein [Cupriavidus sp. M-11]|uniref:FUSC family protein n=1 Tax=Cupriavidus sp. M-11 TaxID=3233038 RepID=UPI003F9008D3
MDTLRRHIGRILDPFGHLRQAKSFHALRVGLAVLASIGLTTGLKLPHGDWATITVLVVIGGFQHHGNIRTRGIERAKGTLLGAFIGLLLVAQQHYLSTPGVTYLLLAATCAYCAYHAIGTGGYVALLAGVTIVIAAGHGTNDLSEGLWRTINVLIGTTIALLLSIALPSYALHAWKLQLGQLLRQGGYLVATVGGDEVGHADLKRCTSRLNVELIQLRSLMASAAKECSMRASAFEDVQHSLRMCVCLLEVLASFPKQNFGTYPCDPFVSHSSPGGRLRTQFERLADDLNHEQPLAQDGTNLEAAATLNNASTVIFIQLADELVTLRSRLHPILWQR